MALEPETDAAAASMTDPSDSPSYGAPRGAFATLATKRPPGLPDPKVWRSPLRGPWLTSVLGFLLLISLPLVILTGLLDWIAYSPQYHQSIPSKVGFLHLPYFIWPTRPVWLFRLTEGLHVGLGLVLVPVVLAKLWSVMPKLFTWPPVKSLAQLAERLSLLFLVGGIVFQMATGVLNIQYDYLFGFNFYTAHYFGAWVFIAAFIIHVSLKLPTMITSLRSRSLRQELRTSIAETVPEPLDEGGLVARDPAEPTVSRRGALAIVAGGSLMVGVLTAGQTVGGFTRRFALLIPRGRSYGNGPNDFQINRTAAAAGVTTLAVDPTWSLQLVSAHRSVTLSRAHLLSMQQHHADLPLACVEGWSVTNSWSGVPLKDLALLAGVASPSSATVHSFEPQGLFNKATLTHDQVLDSDALLALKVNGADLSPDHGYPARIIVPALPGVHCTKWVRSITFEA